MYANQFLKFVMRLMVVLLSMVVSGLSQYADAATESLNAGVGVNTQNESEIDEETRFGPVWSRGMVWYQVFPERFANGNPGNDPVQAQSTTVLWDQSFDEPTIAEIERGWMLSAGEPLRYGFDPGRAGGAIANVIFQRRYGGDLQGVLERLDELQELGVEGIYICPVFTSTSLHKYDAADHRHIDPTLGNPGKISTMGVVKASTVGDPSDESTWDWTDADVWFVETFISAVHERGMKIMLDGVWNHVGMDHWAFDDVREHGSASKYADWFEAEFDDYWGSGELIGWKSWGGNNGGLPVFRQTESGDLAPGPKAHMMAVTRRWMDPNGDGDPSDGIDGWRLDVANEVGRPFWEDWRREVKGLNPEALIVGEIWFDAREYFDGTAFDAQMNYPMAYPVADWLSIGHMKGDANSLVARLREVYTHDLETDLCQLNLMSSHDTERLASLMHNDHQRSFDNGSHPWRDSKTYDRDKASDDALVRALVAYMLMVANPGSSMIYNGDEFGMVGADDPDDRHPIKPGHFDRGGLDSRSRWFREEVRWIMELNRDPRFGELIRLGDAKWEASEDGAGVQVTRWIDDRALVVSIGPCGTQWGSRGGGNVAGLISDVNHRFEQGSSCWSVGLGLIEWPE